MHAREAKFLSLVADVRLFSGELDDVRNTSLLAASMKIGMPTCPRKPFTIRLVTRQSRIRVFAFAVRVVVGESINRWKGTALEKRVCVLPRIKGHAWQITGRQT